MPPNKPASSDRGRIIQGREAFAEAALALAQDARREIALLSFDLPASYYGTQAFYSAVKDMVLDTRHARLRVLVQDPKPAARGHRLVDLGRRLSSFCEFRQLRETDRELRSDWLIVDQRHVLERLTPESLEAICRRDVPATARDTLRRFDDLWEPAQPAVELRTLHLS